MATIASAALRAHLEHDADADLPSLQTDTDRTHSIGNNVWRLRWRDQITTAVAADANLNTTCGALLDALALHHLTATGSTLLGSGPTVDLSTVNVLVDRPLPEVVPAEVDQALRSMRDATHGVDVRLWYQRSDVGWSEDVGPAPTWPDDHLGVTNWVDRYLLPRLQGQPTPFALAIVEAVDDPSLHLYPSPIDKDTADRWALRIDGLQIGIASSTAAILTIGKPGKSGDGRQRAVFIEEAGADTVTVVAENPATGELDVPAAAQLIRRLLRRFRAVDVRGAPLTHRENNGVPFIDEHTLEARLLKGLTWIDSEQRLVLDDHVVARGSQFPTLWTDQPKGRAKYLDAMVRRDTTPIAIELKVATQGQGRYYRRSLVQAVLYRHFIRNAPGLEPWFRAAGLDRSAAQAAIGIPPPIRWTNRFDRDLDLLRSVADRVGILVYVVDDRATPDWDTTTEDPEPEEQEYELLTWRLTAELMRRWPKSLGAVYEAHPAGGMYDMIELRHIRSDAYGSTPAPSIAMNRPGSLWVFSPTGTDRWIWRGIWNYLAVGDNFSHAATVIGAMTGLGSSEETAQPTFGHLGAAFLEEVDQPGWIWRCAWPNDDGRRWIDRYGAWLGPYMTPTGDGTTPKLAQIWGAVREQQATVIVDQTSLRVWGLTPDGPTEFRDRDPLERIRRAAQVAKEGPAH